MLVLAEVCPDLGSARDKCFQCLENGLALERWRQMVKCHGGDPDADLPMAGKQTPVPSPMSGTISAVNAEAIGRASLMLGAGRTKTTDEIDHAVGISNLRKIGEAIDAGEPLCIIHSSNDWTRSEAGSERQQRSGNNETEIFQTLENAFQIRVAAECNEDESEESTEPPPLVLEIMQA